MLTWLKPMFSVRDLDMPDAGRRFDCEVNHCRLPTLSLIYARYGSSFVARMQQSDAFIQGFPIAGAGEVQWRRSVTPTGRRESGSG